MNKLYIFDINLQYNIQRKFGDISPKDIQSSYILFLCFCELPEWWKEYIRRLIK